MTLYILSSSNFAFFSLAEAYNIPINILESSVVRSLETQQAPKCLLPGSNLSSELGIASLSYSPYILELIRLRIILNLRFLLLAAQRQLLASASIALITKYRKRYKF